jgi:hypothetical protein
MDGLFPSFLNGTVILPEFHANSCNLSYRIDNAHRLKRLNLDIFDYCGYGRSEGEPDENVASKDSRMTYKKIVFLSLHAISFLPFFRGHFFSESQ